MKDYYAWLGLSRSAGAADIKRAYRRLAVQYHPDKNPSPEAEAMFKNINEAYETLSDPEKKVAYDQLMENPFAEILSQQPQSRKHRDPAYHRRTPPPFRKKENPALELMKQYQPIAIWISRTGLLVTVVFFLDYYLPHITRNEIVSEVYAVRYRRNISHFMIVTSSGSKIKLYPEDMAVSTGESIEIRLTRIFQTPVSIIKSSGRTIAVDYIYHTHLFLPLLLFAFSVVGVLMESKPEASFNLGLVNAILLIINFVFL